MSNLAFQMAVNIAHQYFWLADDPIVIARAKAYIEKHSFSTAYPLLPQYVAVICSEAVRYENEQNGIERNLIS